MIRASLSLKDLKRASPSYVAYAHFAPNYVAETCEPPCPHWGGPQVSLRFERQDNNEAAGRGLGT